MHPGTLDHWSTALGTAWANPKCSWRRRKPHRLACALVALGTGTGVPWSVDGFAYVGL